MATLAMSIHSVERRLRGGTQAVLVRDCSGAAYVAKFVGNPQGTRTLLNEWVVSRLLRYLQVSTPEVAPLRLTRGIPGDDLLCFQVGNRTVPVEEGIHFGSRCPVDPHNKAIYDFLPRTLLSKVLNLPDLLMAFVFDKWVAQCDSRQAIFIRERLSGQTPRFRAYLIDNGLSFGGSRWEFSDVPIAGLFHDRSIYQHPDFRAISHVNVERIQEVPEEILFSIQQGVPEEWLQPQDRQGMSRLLETLAKRRTTLHDTIERTLLQLEQAGIATPKNANARYMLAILLLASCVPASLAPDAKVNIEPLLPSEISSQPSMAEKDTNTAECGFRCTARNEADEVIGERCIRVARTQDVNGLKGNTGPGNSDKYRYIFRSCGLDQSA
jgi:hypothetical protein